MEDDSNANSIIKNKYKILERKGKGAFGAVFKAEDMQTKKLYAVKIKIKGDESEFENEIKMLKIVSQLKNPYIINIIDSGKELIKADFEKEENRQYIIMDYASKGALYDYIFCFKRGLEKKTAKLIFHKILKGLEDIHKSGICHRDLKIENILMDRFYNPKIGDFGLSTEIKGKNGSGILDDYVGTLKYAPPEMYKQKPYNGVKADVFSLGVVLLNITFGKCGFVKPLRFEKYYKYIYKKDFDKYWEIIECDKQALDEDLKNLYLKMVSYEQDDRPTIKEIFESSWMKEIENLNETEYKNLEKKVYDEFKEIQKKICEKNGTVFVEESESSLVSGENRGNSKIIDNYFNLDLVPKYIEKTGLNMNHYMKIIGKVNPCILMNTIANKIKKKYGDKININASEYKLKFDVCYENMDEEDDEEENNEEEENEEDNDEEGNEDFKNRIKDEKSVIQVKLFESLNGGYIVRFSKKKGGTIEYHQYLEELRNIIKELHYI